MQQDIQKGFSGFAWALALFCLPSALFPLALLVSPQFSSHPGLTSVQIDFFSIVFWVYPVVLFAIAGVLYRLRQSFPTLAIALLLVSFIAFYALAGYIFRYF